MARRLSSPVFVGRSAELGALGSAADAAAAGRAGIAVISGEAGVGKTRLVAELTTRLRERDWLVLEGGAVALGEDALPFGPVVEALRSLVRQIGPDAVAAAAGSSVPELARLVPELDAVAGPSAVPLTQSDWVQTRIFEGVIGLLGRLGASSPVLLIVEDLHWADRSTRDLLSFLARNLRDERVLIIGTYRADELHRRHPLGPWLAEVERLPRFERLDLRRFRRSELADLLAAILGSAPTPGLLDSIARRSDGNAFFAEELVAASDAGDVDGIRPARTLPETLRELLLARLGSVSPAATRLIEVAAVAGRRVEHDVLVAVSGLDERALVEALREAIGAQLLVAERDAPVERYAFRHALVQEAIYDDLLPSERRRLHAAYARVLEDRPASSGAAQASRLVELAHHWSAAHEPARALAAAVAGGDASSAALAFAEAGRQYERAIELWDVVPADDRPGDRDIADLYDTAGAMVLYGGSVSRALTLARHAVELADAAPAAPESRRRRAAFRERYGRAAWQAGDTSTSLAALEEAAELLAGDDPSPEQARVFAGLAANLMLAGLSVRSEPIARRAIELAEAVGDRVTEAHARNTLGTDMSMQGRLEEGLEVLRGALMMAESIGDPFAIGRAYANLGSALEMAGRIEEAADVSLRGAEVNRGVGNGRTFGAFLDLNATTYLIEQGRYAEAAATHERTREFLGPGIFAIFFHNVGAILAVRGGRLAEAGEYLRAAQDEATKLDDAQFTGPHHAAYAEYELMCGDPAAALAISEEGLRRLSGTDDVYEVGSVTVPGVRAAADLVVAARAARDEAGARAATERLDAVIARYRAVVGDRVLGTIASEQVGWRLALIEAERARAVGDDDPARWAALRAPLARRPSPHIEAYVLLRQAEAHAETGDAAAAGDALRDAFAVATRIGLPLLVGTIEATARRLRIDLVPAGERVVPADTEAPGGSSGDGADPDPFGLTAREREVLALVADGLTNRRIAAALYISESTAGVHVSNILGKLGVASRTEAATIAVRLGLDRAPEG